ncbi:MAG TPA: hypothetical protein P5105_06455, partial [Victivallales bacterium]|nr:hypothetical protein [Victivallales bacterium]
PAIAGLKIFFPKPPKSCLLIIIAKDIPIADTCHGIVGGIISAKIVDVTNTDSLICSFLLLQNTYSQNRPIIMLQIKIKNVRHPK